MIRIFIIAFLLCINAVQAQPIKPQLYSFTLQKSPLQTVVSIVYGEVLKEPFLLDDVVKDNYITINFKNADPKALREVLDAYLLSKGIKRIVQSGMNLFVPNDKTLSSVAATESAASTAKNASLPAIDKLLSQNEKVEDNQYKIYHPLHRSSVELHKLASAIAPLSQVIGDDVLLIGAPSKLLIAKLLFDQYDTQRNEVNVKATIVEYTSSKDDGAGVFGAIKTLSSRLNLSIGDNTPFTNILTFKTASLEAVVSAINQDSRFTVVDTSTLRILSGKIGVLNVGQEVPVLAGASTDAKGNPVQNIIYRSGGLQLKVSPTVIGDRVQAEVNQSLSSFAVTRTSNIDSPTQLKREFNSFLSAEYGEVIVLGGLDESKSTNASNSLFGLKLGTNRTDAKTTLFLVLQFLKV
jgi:general secretion pathway protein D